MVTIIIMSYDINKLGKLILLSFMETKTNSNL
jgi:hypothetical protein